jgi:mycoredoxin
MSDASIIMYGTSWCSDCRRSQRFLEQRGVAYTYINIEQDAAAAQRVIELNNGNRSVPTIVFADGSILVEPSNQELERKLFG